MQDSLKPGSRPWQQHLFRVVFESDTPAGKAFDVGLLIVILVSFLAVCLESVSAFEARYGQELRVLEWVVTISFTVEYLLRLMIVSRPRHYATSFFGLVDFVSVLPTYVGYFYPQSRYLTTVRVLRLLRVFRIFKLTHYVSESSALAAALLASRRKIAVFVFSVLNLVVVIGATMYVVEGPAHGFTSIPTSIYWAIVTLTTVGYGDISPVTPLGQFISCIVMILGYGVIAVPTGIVTVEMSQAGRRRRHPCGGCGTPEHDIDASFCKSCGWKLSPEA